MKFAIVGSGLRKLKKREVVGGGPVVAIRQAKALQSLGLDVVLIDVELVSEGDGGLIEEWFFDEKKVLTWAFNESSRSLGDIVSLNSCKKFFDFEVCDYYLVQESVFGNLLKAGFELGRRMIWQPNDYHFLCVRSWFLKANGQMCDMRPSPSVCARCQLVGRNFIETSVFNALNLGNKLGLGVRLLDVNKKIRDARNRASAISDFLGNCSLVLAQSSKMVEALLAQGYPRGKILHINYGVVPTAFRKNKPSDTPSRVRFAYIARPSYEKGLHILLEAWQQLPTEVLEKASLIVYSPIATASRFYKKRLVALLQKCRNVELSNESVAHRLDEVYSSVDVAVQPALWVDHNTQTILEALARGVPVVIPKGTSFDDGLVDDGVNGLVVERGSVSSLVDVINKITLGVGVLSSITNSRPYVFTDDDWARRVLSGVPKLV